MGQQDNRTMVIFKMLDLCNEEQILTIARQKKTQLKEQKFDSVNLRPAVEGKDKASSLSEETEDASSCLAKLKTKFNSKYFLASVSWENFSRNVDKDSNGGKRSLFFS